MGESEVYMVVEVDEDEFGEMFIVKKEFESQQPEEVGDNEFTCTVDNSEETVFEDGEDNPVEIVYLPEFIDEENASNYTIMEGQVIDGNIVYNPQNKPRVSLDGVSTALLNKRSKPKLKENSNSNKLPSVRTSRLASKSGVDKRTANRSRKREKVWQHVDFIPDEISSITMIHTGSEQARALGECDATSEGSEVVVSDPTRPHKCEYCEQSFRQSTSLQLHLSSFHKIIPDSCIVS